MSLQLKDQILHCVLMVGIKFQLKTKARRAVSRYVVGIRTFVHQHGFIGSDTGQGWMIIVSVQRTDNFTSCNTQAATPDELLINNCNSTIA